MSIGEFKRKQSVEGQDASAFCGSSRAKRRLEEVKQLPFQVFAISRWHYRVGSLHIWIHAGRWCNEATGVQGSLRTAPIKTLAISEWNRQL